MQLLNRAKVEHDRSQNNPETVIEMLKEKIADKDLSIAVTKLPDWEIIDGKLNRSFKFHNFVDACGFMTKVFLVSEKIDHHPELTNTYNHVAISLFTHDLDGISSLDIELAKRIDTLI